MKLTEELRKKGFALREATDADLPAWLESKMRSQRLHAVSRFPCLIPPFERSLNA